MDWKGQIGWKDRMDEWMELDWRLDWIERNGWLGWTDRWSWAFNQRWFSCKKNTWLTLQLDQKGSNETHLVSIWLVVEHLSTASLRIPFSCCSRAIWPSSCSLICWNCREKLSLNVLKYHHTTYTLPSKALSKDTWCLASFTLQESDWRITKIWY